MLARARDACSSWKSGRGSMSLSHMLWLACFLTSCTLCYLLGSTRQHAAPIIPSSSSAAAAGNISSQLHVLGMRKPWCPIIGMHPPFHFPKVIHQTMPSKQNISCELLESMATWRDQNPGYEHRLYDDKDCRDFVARDYPEILPVYDHLHSPVERADLWRYLVLHRYGGVYADVDVKCMRPVDEWNAHNGHDASLLLPLEFLDRTGGVQQCGNFVLAAMPCHAVMAAAGPAMVAGIALSALQGREAEGGVLSRTGPMLLTGVVERYAGAAGVKWPVDGRRGALNNAGNLVGQVRIMPVELMAMGWETAQHKTSCAQALKAYPAAYICHQFFGSWKKDYQFRRAETRRDDCRYWGSQTLELPSVLG